MTVTALSRPALEARLGALHEDSTLTQRKAALEQFLTRGFPTTHHEDWKYTDLSGVIDVSNRTLVAAGGETPATATIAAIKTQIDAHWLVIVNGRIDSELSDEAAGFDISSATQNPDIDDPLADLNAVLATTDITIRFDANTHRSKPIALLFADHANTAPGTSHSRVTIEAERDSSAQIIEYHVSSGDAEQYANVFIAANIATGANLDYVRLQNRARHHLQTARMNVTLHERSNIRHFGLDLGAALARNDLKIEIDGAEASAEFNGLYIGSGKQHIDNHTRVDHRVGPARSTQEYRGILTGQSRGVWNGKAIVHPGADGTDAEQANHNLLLSAHAEINAKPELEIYADEVKCSHGTTVGQLDENAIFYLRSRGLDEDRAKRILTRAFATSVIDKAPIAALREPIGHQVEQQLAELGGGSD